MPSGETLPLTLKATLATGAFKQRRPVTLVSARRTLLRPRSTPCKIPESSRWKARGRLSDFDTVFATLGQLTADGLIVGDDAFFNTHIRELAALTIRHAIPAIFQNREFTAAGGLMSYTGSVPDEYR